MPDNSISKLTDGLYIIAEMSANHMQDIDRAKRIIEEAKRVGANAIKVQAYRPDTMTVDVDIDKYQFWGTIWEGKKPYDLYDEAHMPWEWIPDLYEFAKSVGIDFFSSVYDSSSVRYLDELGVDTFKIASFELVDIPLLREVGERGKRVIISTGMASFSEIEEAVDVLKRSGSDDIHLLKCTTAYPAKVDDANVLTIPHMKRTFGFPVGISDHTLGHAVVCASVALGATIVEKHMTLARKDGGPDGEFSLEPHEFMDMVKLARDVRSSLGRVSYEATGAQEISRKYRRSLFAVKDILAGETITKENVKSMRPSGGLHPRYYETIIGMTAISDIENGTPISWDRLK
jgi:pseudaminic acid synthase